MATEMTFVTVPDQDGLSDFQRADVVEIDGVRFARERAGRIDVEYRGDCVMSTYSCCGYVLREYAQSPYPECAMGYCPKCGARVVEP